MIGEKINKTIARWNADEVKLDEDSKKEKSLWKNWPSWEIFLAMIFTVVVTTGLLWAGKKLWEKWTSIPKNSNPKNSGYFQVHRGAYKKSSGTGLAAIEDLGECEEILPSQTGQSWFEVDPRVPVDSQNMVHMVQVTTI